MDRIRDGISLDFLARLIVDVHQVLGRALCVLGRGLCVYLGGLCVYLGGLCVCMRYHWGRMREASLACVQDSSRVTDSFISSYQARSTPQQKPLAVNRLE